MSDLYWPCFAAAFIVGMVLLSTFVVSKLKFNALKPIPKVCSAEHLIWTLRGNTAQLEAGPGCRMRTFSQLEARQCLSTHRLLLFGDSLLTYQYLSLVLFLHTGHRGGDFANQTVLGYPNILLEGSWAPKRGVNSRDFYSEDWQNYYRGTSALFDGAELCDCFRDRCHPTCIPQTYANNRHYRFVEGKYQGLVSIVNSMGNKLLTTRGHTLDEKSWRLSCNGSSCQKQPDWEFTNTSQAMIGMSKVLRPSIVLAGVPNHWPSDDKSARSIAADIKATGTPLGYRIVWRTCTPSRDTPDRTDEVPSDSIIHDSFRITLRLRRMYQGRLDEMYVDNGHFQPWVYFQLNQLLLNQIFEP